MTHADTAARLPLPVLRGAAWRRVAALPCLAGLIALAGCGSSPPANISLPTPGAAGTTEQKTPALQTQRIQYKHTQPGCRGADCPFIDVDSIAFPGANPLTTLVDESLASMTGLDTNVRPAYHTLEAFEQHYWRTARPRENTVLRARLMHQTPSLAVIELISNVYTGGAHGIPATRYLNWDRQAVRALTLADVLEPGRQPNFEQALQRAHAQWLQGNADAKQDPAGYDKLWPFTPSDNIALAKDGLIVKYDAYVIAPYSHGQPELTIPYAQLRGILRPGYLPAN